MTRVILIFLLFWAQNVFAQEKSSVAFQVSKFWNSVPTGQGGFKFTKTVNNKSRYQFVFYPKYVSIVRGKVESFSVVNIDRKYLNETKYYVKDAHGQDVLLVLTYSQTTGKPDYYIDYFKVSKTGQVLSLTKFSCHKIN
jgi:hypothetical protein